MSAPSIIAVRDVMVQDPLLIHGLATVHDALTLMRAHNVSSLVVERRDAQDEFGLLLLADIARELIGRNRPVQRTNVYEVMIKPAPAVDADMQIKYAVRHMSRFGFSHCIVSQGRDLAGLVTLRDMALHFIDDAKQ